MRLYNSKTNTIEEFIPLKENEVSLYVCGPTVYNYAHIGNARPIVVFDLLRRVLEANQYHVKMVSNFTDVDDKIIKKALDENVSEREISDRYIEAYNRIRSELHAEGLAATPRVTDTMDEIIAFIEELVNDGYAYAVKGDVYFRVNKVKSYGEVSSQNIEELIVGSRIEENSNKENPLDFVLWKNTDDTGIKWDSPWGKGRPGWHTECVVMIQDEFKMNRIDIHGGGQDLKFPHHENESAQCKALHGHDLANYWVHNAMVNFAGEKMSKSLGNVVWAQDYIEELGANLTRWLLLSTHYRLVLNITDDLISQSRKELDKIETVLRQASLELQVHHAMDQGTLSETYASFIENLNDDLNVANAQVVLFEEVKALNSALRLREKNMHDVAKHYHTIRKMMDVLGVVIEEKILDDADIELLSAWALAKQEKRFEDADGYRQKLIEKGII